MFYILRIVFFLFIYILIINSKFTFAEKTLNEKYLNNPDLIDFLQLITLHEPFEICRVNEIKIEICSKSNDLGEPCMKIGENVEDTNIQIDRQSTSTTSITSNNLESNSPTITDIKTNFPLGITLNLGETALRAINRSLDLFTNRLKEKFSIWLQRSSQYIGIMKDILKEKNLPTELVFLPLIESGFNLNAYSRAHAVGPWQFIEATAKRYGLIIDWWRDERKDPIKATKAAADYLKDLYRMFGSWELALAAYNAGEGKISRALKRTYTNDYWELLKTNYIKDETKKYVPHYIAATLIAKNPTNFGFHSLEYSEPLYYDEVTLDHPIDIEVIALCAETTVSEIRKLNAELRRWSTPPHTKSYKIRIPHGTKQQFLQNLERIPLEKRFSYDLYKVKKGETLKTIAKKLNIPTIAIIELNSFSGLEKLQSGDLIKVPPKDKFFVDLQDKKNLKKNVSQKTTSNQKKESKKRSSKKTCKL